MRIEIQVDPIEKELLVLIDSWCLSVQGTKATVDCTVRKSRKRCLCADTGKHVGGGWFSIKTDKSEFGQMFLRKRGTRVYGLWRKGGRLGLTVGVCLRRNFLSTFTRRL